MRRAAAAGVGSLLGVVVTAGAAWATPVLAPQDAQTLSRRLSEATAVQGICYGWDIAVGSASGRPEAGSNLGADIPLAEPAPPCERQLVLSGVLQYTDEFSDAEDSAVWSVRGTPQEDAAISIAEIERVTGLQASDLLGDDDDKALYTAVAALPLLAAERGLAPPLPLPAVPATVPDAPAEVGAGSDFLRENAAPLGIGAVLLLGGAGAALYGRSLTDRPAGRRGRPAKPCET